MSSLEELILTSGAMTEAQLDVVQAEKSKLGGSLDANILALGFLTEHALERLLLQSFPRFPGVNPRAEPAPEALVLLSADRSKALGIVPQRLVGRQLHILMDDPTTLTLLGGEPSFAPYDLVPVAVNEVRLRFLQERHYGLPREPRYVEIMDRLLSRAREKEAAKNQREDQLIGDPLAGLEPEWMAGAMQVPTDAASPEKDLAAEEIPLLEEELLLEEGDESGSAGGEDTSALPLVEAHEALSPMDFRAALDATTSMDDLPEVFFRFGVSAFRSVSLFKVQSNMMMGWRGAGLGIASDLIRGIVVPVQSDTFLARAVETGLYVGQGTENLVEERIVEQMGATPDAFVVTAAVKVASRPVLVVCCLTDGDSPGQEVLSDFSRLCEQASETVLRLILSRKQADTGKPAGRKPPSKKKAAKKKST